MGRWSTIFTDDSSDEQERLEPFYDELNQRLNLLMRSFGPPPPPILGERGACRGLSVEQRDELFFYEGPDAKFVNERTVSEWCNRCEVKDECLAYAMSIPSLYGIWGGTTAYGRECIRQPGLRAAKQERAKRARIRSSERGVKAADLSTLDHHRAKGVGVAMDRRTVVDARHSFKVRLRFRARTTGVTPRLVGDSSKSMADALLKLRAKARKMPELVAIIDEHLKECDMQSSSAC